MKHVLLYDIERAGKEGVLPYLKALLQNSLVDSLGPVELAWMNIKHKSIRICKM
jgi:hypothetical protein